MTKRVYVNTFQNGHFNIIIYLFVHSGVHKAQNRTYTVFVCVPAQ